MCRSVLVKIDLKEIIFTDHVRSTREGNVLKGVCLSTARR